MQASSLSEGPCFGLLSIATACDLPMYGRLLLSIAAGSQNPPASGPGQRFSINDVVPRGRFGGQARSEKTQNQMLGTSSGNVIFRSQLVPVVKDRCRSLQNGGRW